MLSNKVAVRISRSTAASPPPYTWVNTDFYEDEVMVNLFGDGRGYTVQTSQSGVPTLFLLTENYRDFTVQFKLNRMSTLQKLKTLRDWTSDSGRLVIYPSYSENPTYFLTVIMLPGSVPDYIFLKGYEKAEEILTVRFLEYDKAPAFAEEDLL